MVSVEGADAATVVTIGSVHTDLIAFADRLPGWGETLHGSGFSSGLGGKAGNQAIAAARCGARSMILGRVGNDRFGDALRETLLAAGVDCSLLGTDRAVATGASTVISGPDGDYASVIVPGASGRLGSEELESARPVLEKWPVLLAQLEIPVDVTIQAAAIVRAGGGRMVLNASPIQAAADVPAELIGLSDILVVNRREASTLLEIDQETVGITGNLARAVRTALGVPAVVVTLGSDGAVASEAGGDSVVEGFDVTVVDTVGAGDAFAGALAAQIARAVTVRDALPFANAAGALAVARAGGAAALPHREEIERFLATASTTPP